MNRNVYPGRLAREGRRVFVIGLLELVASQRPDFLGPLIEALEYGPAGRGLAEIAKVWGVGPEDRVADLEVVAARTSKQLDTLESRRTSWRHPGQVVDKPNFPALVSFARVRRSRVLGVTRIRRLDIVLRKVERVAEIELQRRQIDAFLQEPSEPVDVAAFMDWQDK